MTQTTRSNLTSSRDDCRPHQKRKRVSRVATARRSSRSSIEIERQTPTSSTRTAISSTAGGTITVAAEKGGSPTSPLTERSEGQRPVQSTPGSVGFGVTGIDIHAQEDGEYLYKRHLVEFIDQPELIKRPIDNKARMTYIGTDVVAAPDHRSLTTTRFACASIDVSNVNYLVQQQFGAAVHTSEVCHYPTNRISRRAAGHDPVDRLPLDTFQLPPKAVVDELLEAYFRHVNPGFPVVDERIFMNQYRARDSLNPPSLLLLYAILLVGAHALYEDDSEKRHLAKATYFRRAKSLEDSRFESNRDTVVQAALLLTWHTDGLEDATANAWYWLGIAVRVATGLGMHRDAEGSTLVQHNKRMWRRVWLLLFQSDAWISLQYGRPQSIYLEDSNVQKLKVSDFADCGPDAQPESLVQMSELAIIVSKAMRERNRASSDEARRIVLRKTDERLASWALRLPQSLNLHGTPGAGVWNTNLHLHYNMALILLHRAPPKASSLDVSGVESSQRDDNTEICVAAAGVIQSLFQTLCQTDGIKCLWMSTINCLFSALVQLSTEIRISNPLLAISALRRYDSALVSLKQLAEYWPNAKSILHFFENSVRINSRLQDSHDLPELIDEEPENQDESIQHSTLGSNVNQAAKDNEELAKTVQ
ncbi:fungal specific transcription factor domain-containing protein [Colletotrichum kahawae]|uniref:Fungal specific transcription factor domain-containing protein n=1 Tax=Colletotrichum kahawae TaxID=34407 RepID=A0AAE0D573_COLKA|nr:fungal specific transcription factor domain-containing protein [Colletotrichum kahawae]